MSIIPPRNPSPVASQTIIGIKTYRGLSARPVELDLKMHKWASQVRDYEVDVYGGVNAATYLNYMEEARKHYLAGLGIDLALLAKRNIGFVVGRYEIDYLCSLVGGDEFVIETTMERVSRLKVEFTQLIYRLKDRKLAIRCKNVGLPIDIEANKVDWPSELDAILVDFPYAKKSA